MIYDIAAVLQVEADDEDAVHILRLRVREARLELTRI